MENSPAFNALSRANFAAQMSEQMALSAMPIIAVVALAATVEQTAMLQMVATLPFLLFSIAAGVWADRGHCKALMIATESLRAVALCGLLALLYAQFLSVAGLAALGFIVATGTVAFSVCVPAVVQQLVVKDDLLVANRRLELLRSASYVGGPAIGGVLAGWLSGVPAMGAALALSVVCVFYVRRLPLAVSNSTPQRKIGLELAEGARFITGNRLIRPIVITALVFNTSWYFLMAVFAYDAIHRLAFTPSQVGFALGLYGAGMVVGAWVYPLLARGLRFGTQILVGPICAALAALLMAATTLLPAKLLVFVAFFGFGAGPIVWTIATMSLRQAITPSHLMARVSAFIMTCTFGARPLGALLGAWVSSQWDTRACLIGVAIGFGVQLAVIVFSAPARLRSLADSQLEECETSTVVDQPVP